MQIKDLNSLSEKIAFVNGHLNAVAVLNTTADNDMDYYLVMLKLENLDIDSCLRKYLKAPNWTFTLKPIQKWDVELKREAKPFFTNILSEILDKDGRKDLKKFYKTAERLNLVGLLDNLVFSISNILEMYSSPTFYSIEIKTNGATNEGYFAHAESNFVFKLNENEILYLHFSSAD